MSNMIRIESKTLSLSQGATDEYIFTGSDLNQLDGYFSTIINVVGGRVDLNVYWSYDEIDWVFHEKVFSSIDGLNGSGVAVPLCTHIKLEVVELGTGASDINLKVAVQ
ncbi:MAG: hypothetical protein GY928_37550 [Colwellia sp.]|nr:hypothetical protein [Colwellia sp.]